MEWCLTFNWLCENQSDFLSSLLPNFWQSIRFDSSSDSFIGYTDWPLPDFCQLIRFILSDLLISKSHLDFDLSKYLTDFRWLLKSIEYALCIIDWPLPEFLLIPWPNDLSWVALDRFTTIAFVYNSTDWPLPDFCYLIWFILSVALTDLFRNHISVSTYLNLFRNWFFWVALVPWIT